MSLHRGLLSNRFISALVYALCTLMLLSMAACKKKVIPTDEDYKIDDPGYVSLIDTSKSTPVVQDGYLYANLQDGHQVKLRIRTASAEITPKTDCSKEIYLDIGSLAYLRKLREEHVAITPTDRTLVFDRREEFRREFINRVTGNPYQDPDYEIIDCNLTLDPGDIIYKRLVFSGPKSSGVIVDCPPDDHGRHARIFNPATTSELAIHEKDPAMLTFSPDNCGIDPLSDGRYVDDRGAVISRCDPVTDVKIKKCIIRGRTVASSFTGNYFTLSMTRADHVKRLRESAAQHATFTEVKIKGRYQGAIHFLPGVNHFTIQDSDIDGGFIAMTIHLPQEGGWNVIKNNRITGQRKTAAWGSYEGKKREVISIDASEHNRIVNNYFRIMPYGAISLYRNCGEHSDIRQRVPQYNQIINNVFDYAGQGSDHHVIEVGSRDDMPVQNATFGVKRYCHRDQARDGSRYTGNDVPEKWDTEVIRNSSESNSDWAMNNVIADNQVIHRDMSLDDAYYLSSKARKLTNYLIGNEVASRRSATEALRIRDRRHAGCAVLAGITHGMIHPYLPEIRNGYLPYIRDGWDIKYFWDIRPEVRLQCGDHVLKCNNNVLSVKVGASCTEPVIYDFGNQAVPCNGPGNVCAESNNSGDQEMLGCPNGGSLLGIQAACNLEQGRTSDARRSKVLLNHMEVVRPSDNIGQGLCKADGTSLSEQKKLILPWLFRRYKGLANQNRINYFCKEHDENGGDCQVNIRHYCEVPDLI